MSDYEVMMGMRMHQDTAVQSQADKYSVTEKSVKHSLIVSSLKNTITTPGGPGRMSLLFISAAALGNIIVTFPGPSTPPSLNTS